MPRVHRDCGKSSANNNVLRCVLLRSFTIITYYYTRIIRVVAILCRGGDDCTYILFVYFLPFRSVQGLQGITTTRDVGRDDDRREAINRRGRRRREILSSSPQLYVIAVVLITSLFLEHHIGTSTHCTLRRTITVRNAKIAVFRQKITQKIHCTRVASRL